MNGQERQELRDQIDQARRDSLAPVVHDERVCPRCYELCGSNEERCGSCGKILVLSKDPRSAYRRRYT